MERDEPTLIAPDGDGVLLDYNERYAAIFSATLGLPLAKAPGLYHRFSHAYNALATPEQTQSVRAAFAVDGWRTMPPIEGAVEGSLLLAEAGARQVCVTSMPARFSDDRLRNLLDLGMPFEGVVATNRDPSTPNPKAAPLAVLMPDVFADDQLRNFIGLDERICRVHIDPGYLDPDHPDRGLDPSLAHFRFASYRDFAKAFCADPAPFLAFGAKQARKARRASGRSPRP
jgi:hypothetical protein